MLKLKLQYFGPPDVKNRLTGKDTDAGEGEGRRRRGGQKQKQEDRGQGDWMASLT